MTNSKKIRHKNKIFKSFEKLFPIEKEKHHPIIHRIHKKHNISKKTLFYAKEYGKKSNVPRTIIKESLKILLLASVISSLGGLALESIETLFLSILPLVILLPVLNGMIGNYGTVISSRFSEMLHERKVRKKWWKTLEIRKLFFQIFTMTIIGAVLSSVIAIGITHFSYRAVAFDVALKVFTIVLVNMIILTSILFFVAIFSGIYIYKKKKDPNNFLIPITTGVADFSNMVILTILILILF